MGEGDLWLSAMVVVSKPFSHFLLVI